MSMHYTKILDYTTKHGIEVKAVNDVYGPSYDKQYFNDSSNYNMITTVQNHSFKQYILAINENDLEDLIRVEDAMLANGLMNNYFRVIAEILEQKEKESYLINSNESVKEAFEVYSAMLNLARLQELTNGR